MVNSVFGSSSVGGSVPGRISREVRSAVARAPAPSPTPGGGLPPRGPPHAPVEESDAEDMLRRARERRALHEEFLQRAVDAMSRIGAELADEDARLEAEGLRLAEERRKLKVAVAIARHQRDLDNAKAEASVGERCRKQKFSYGFTKIHL